MFSIVLRNPHNLLVSGRNTTSKALDSNKANHVYASKLITNLYDKKQTGKLSKNEKLQIISKANKIYSSIDAPKQYSVINGYLRLCLDLQCPERMITIWDDVCHNCHFREISYVSLFNCSVQSKEINKSIKVLEWMNNHQYKVKQQQYKSFSTNVSKLISFSNKNIDNIKQIHLLTHSMESTTNDIFIKTALINAYGNCSKLDEAINIFKSVDKHKIDHILISSLMKSYIKNNDAQAAILLYDQFNYIHNNDVLTLLAIKSCVHINDYSKGKKIIDEQINIGNSCVSMKTTLINFYGHFGKIQEAENVFNTLEASQKNVVIIGSMMNALLQNGMNEKVIFLFDKHRNNWIDPGMYVCVIQAYSNMSDTNSILTLFHSANKNDKSNMIGHVMKGLIKNECHHTALSIYRHFEQNESDKNMNDALRHIMALKCCINANDFKYGKQIDDKVTAMGRNTNHFIEFKTTLIDFYGHFGDIDKAFSIFDSISDDNKSVVTIGAMMKCLLNNEYYQQCLDVYQKYSDLNNNITHLLAIKACGYTQNLVVGKQICSKIDRYILDLDKNLKNTLIEFYGQCGDILNANNIFDSIDDKEKSIENIGAMMNAYYECDLNNECIELFKNINNNWSHLMPDIVCYTIMLRACCQSTSYHFGQQIHDDLKININGNKWMLLDSNIQCGLINFYAKCSKLDICQQIFDDIKLYQFEEYCNNIYIWNAMINAYGTNGIFKDAKQMFDSMISETKLNPNRETYVALMNCCVHSGETNEAYKIWVNIDNDSSLKYDSVIISKLIDCYARNGFIKQAYDLLMDYERNKIEKESKNNDKAMWMSVLNACNVHEHQTMAETVFQQMSQRFDL